tara:strand:+ start:95 stop:976 length:882 start_codon:yes stop_codon:yes gene_type:complete
MSDINDRLEKQMEGTNLALAAVAEVLQKMDDRLSKAEEQEYLVNRQAVEENEMNQAVAEKTELVKAIAGEVLDVIKGVGESKQGMEVDGSGSRKAKASTGSSGTVTGGGNDDAKAAPTAQGTKTVGQAIEAMQKQLQLIKDGYGVAKDEEEYPETEEGTEDEGEGDPDTEGEDAEGSEEEPKEYPFDQAIQNLQKQMNDFQKNMGNKIVNESERRLAKMGFKEETSLQSPSLIHYDDVNGNPLGIDGTTPVTKADGGADVADQLAEMSYKQLRDLQFKIEAGETDGVPRELLG